MNTQKKFSHKPNNKDKYNDEYYGQVDNTYGDMVSEECAVCGRELTKTKDILVDQFDRYICYDCAYEHQLEVIPCMDLV